MEFYRRFYGEYLLGKMEDKVKPTVSSMRSLGTFSTGKPCTSKPCTTAGTTTTTTSTSTTSGEMVWSHPANAIDVSQICPDQIDGLEEWDYGSGLVVKINYKKFQSGYRIEFYSLAS